MTTNVHRKAPYHLSQVDFEFSMLKLKTMFPVLFFLFWHSKTGDLKLNSLVFIFFPLQFWLFLCSWNTHKWHWDQKAHKKWGDQGEGIKYPSCSCSSTELSQVTFKTFHDPDLSPALSASDSLDLREGLWVWYQKDPQRLILDSGTLLYNTEMKHEMLTLLK